MLSDLIIGRTLLVSCEVLHAQVMTKITRRRLSCAVIFIISQQTRKQKRKMYRSNIFLRDYYNILLAIFYKNSKRFRIPRINTYSIASNISYKNVMISTRCGSMIFLHVHRLLSQICLEICDAHDKLKVLSL